MGVPTQTTNRGQRPSETLKGANPELLAQLRRDGVEVNESRMRSAPPAQGESIFAALAATATVASIELMRNGSTGDSQADVESPIPPASARMSRRGLLQTAAGLAAAAVVGSASKAGAQQPLEENRKLFSMSPDDTVVIENNGDETVRVPVRAGDMLDFMGGVRHRLTTRRVVDGTFRESEREYLKVNSNLGVQPPIRAIKIDQDPNTPVLGYEPGDNMVLSMDETAIFQPVPGKLVGGRRVPERIEDTLYLPPGYRLVKNPAKTDHPLTGVTRVDITGKVKDVDVFVVNERADIARAEREKQKEQERVKAMIQARIKRRKEAMAPGMAVMNGTDVPREGERGGYGRFGVRVVFDDATGAMTVTGLEANKVWEVPTRIAPVGRYPVDEAHLVTGDMVIEVQNDSGEWVRPPQDRRADGYPTVSVGLLHGTIEASGVRQAEDRRNRLNQPHYSTDYRFRRRYPSSGRRPPTSAY